MYKQSEKKRRRKHVGLVLLKLRVGENGHSSWYGTFGNGSSRALL